MKDLAIRGGKFYAVGALGIAVQLAAVWLLRAKLGLDAVLATSLAVEAAVLHNFVWHQRWTWRDRRGGWRETVRRLALFHVSNGLVSLAGNVAIVAALGSAGIHYLAANVAGIAACSLLNFALAEWMVFRRPG